MVDIMLGNFTLNSNRHQCATCSKSDVCMYRDKYQEIYSQLVEGSSTEMPEIFRLSLSCDRYQACTSTIGYGTIVPCSDSSNSTNKVLG